MPDIAHNPAAAKAAATAMKAITATAKKRSNKLSEPAVADAEPELEAAMEKGFATSPEFLHVTNSEPWYTKRSRWSAIIGPAAMVIGIAMKFTGIDYSFGASEQILVADALTAVGTVVAGWFAYRAGVATKPLGS